ncbi:MAG: rRNA pseudouridine synthase [Candidatus Syntrophonatronum acetioxidans]|uniref:Pseudouridine synthase n=1 Tax=Candidatus Syntrophonatronum acetioxidans TaxID=1795816 RepID=A0A424YFK9_9FIRM|nr:MAG: rRNA pseudouridine synthase [Candidatus Syntrophonatronum acetioxidans]
MRLQKFLSRAGVASRRASEELIKEGRVKVDGKVVTTLGTRVDPEKEEVRVDGKVISPGERNVYLLLYKPSGYITSVKDTHGRSTVMDLLPEIKERVYPVGRLDKETEGLLLFTNDGKLAYRLTHPRFGISKKYFVKIQGLSEPGKLKELEKGIALEEGHRTSPAKIRILEHDTAGRRAKVEVEIQEGRKRQVRKMFSKIGCRVVKLKRIQFSFLTLKGLKEGSYRFLREEEVRRLKKEAGF